MSPYRAEYDGEGIRVCGHCKVHPDALSRVQRLDHWMYHVLKLFYHPLDAYRRWQP